MSGEPIAPGSWLVDDDADPVTRGDLDLIGTVYDGVDVTWGGPAMTTFSNLHVVDAALGLPLSNDLGAVGEGSPSGPNLAHPKTDQPGVAGVLGSAATDGVEMAVGDVDADGFDDLGIADPASTWFGGTAGPWSGPGAVHALYGSLSGPSASGDQIWGQSSAGIRVTHGDDAFGTALAVGRDPVRLVPADHPEQREHRRPVRGRRPVRPGPPLSR